MSLYFQSDQVTLFEGDALSICRDLPSNFVNCVVTSPPYYGLRDYGKIGQYGMESSPDHYVKTLQVLFQEIHRVLTDDGTMWINLGDSYGPDKSLYGIPWRVALALKDDGWILRNSIVWESNAIPESVRDRLASKYEMIFLFSKSREYWFNLDDLRRPAQDDRPPVRRKDNETWNIGSGTRNNGYRGSHPLGVNPGDVWRISSTPFRGGCHFATFPATLPLRAIVAGCRPCGIVLDPFHGTGTTAVAALQTRHPYIGIDLNPEYLDLSIKNENRLAPFIRESK